MEDKKNEGLKKYLEICTVMGIMLMIGSIGFFILCNFFAFLFFTLGGRSGEFVPIAIGWIISLTFTGLSYVNLKNLNSVNYYIKEGERHGN